MSAWLRNTSIRNKILVLVMAVTTVALILASGSLLAWDYRQFKIDIGREISSQARMVLENSTAAISFRDQKAANETLETLSPNPHIRAGCLYDPDGLLFAIFAPTVNPGSCPPRVPSSDYDMIGGALRVVAHTQVAGNPGGSMYIESDLDAVSNRARVQAITAGIVLILLLGVAFIASAIFQRFISGPVDALVRTAEDVSHGNDYSLRAQKTTGDELGVLVDAFNGMLGHIEHAEQEREVLLGREREANRLKDEFLMTLSHELRTPLNAIQGWSSVIRSGAIPPDEIPQALQRIERNVKAQARLIEDLLEVSRFASGKFRLDLVSVDLVAITNQAIETIAPTAAARQITIERHFDVANARLNGDPDRLQQVVWNLLSNAVKFSALNARVTIALSVRGRNCELTVHDSGAGIDAAFLPHVFEPFRQADASTTRAHGGLGLGLSIVHRIVTLHGGRIEAASPGTGKGATFTLQLPLAAGDASTGVPSMAEAQSSSLIGKLTGLSVLVVDDDDDAREVLSTVLKAAGAAVHEAASSARAMQVARAHAIDVLISDIAMPDQDGYTLIREMHEATDVKTPRLSIALTAQASDTDRDRATKAGFDRHVAKPFDQRALVQLMREALPRL